MPLTTLGTLSSLFHFRHGNRSASGQGRQSFSGSCQCKAECRSGLFYIIQENHFWPVKCQKSWDLQFGNNWLIYSVVLKSGESSRSSDVEDVEHLALQARRQGQYVTLVCILTTLNRTSKQGGSAVVTVASEPDVEDCRIRAKSNAAPLRLFIDQAPHNCYGEQ